MNTEPATTDITTDVTTDIVIAGGGIAGSGLAAMLARSGLRVTVLERTTTFPDRVRGEMWCPWGVAIADDNGLLQPLLDAGAFFTTRWAFYDDAFPAEVAEEMAQDVSVMVPGVPGILNIGHPTACNAMAGHAIASGATLIRGVQTIELDRSGDRRVLHWTAEDGTAGSVQASLVVGADGRASGIRRQAGIELHVDPVRQYMTGVLVESDEPLSSHIDAQGTGQDVNWYSFPQGPNRSRVYLAHFDPQRFTGPDGSAKALAALGQSACPDVKRLSQGRLVSPIATQPSVDSWTETPYADGVVLVGDSGGYNDPIVGQGLSLTMADLRDVAAVILAGGRRREDFVAYGIARRDRHAKQRVASRTLAEIMCSFGESHRDQRLRALPLLGTDEVVSAIAATLFVGPEMLPPGTDLVEAGREKMLAA